METRKQAMGRARRTANQLGPGWKPVVWENLGWHAKAVSECGRVKVHPSLEPWTRRIESYTAFLGRDASEGGIFTGSGRSPKEAVLVAYGAASEARRDISRILSNPPSVEGQN